jgi:hypothetical protein
VKWRNLPPEAMLIVLLRRLHCLRDLLIRMKLIRRRREMGLVSRIKEHHEREEVVHVEKKGGGRRRDVDKKDCFRSMNLPIEHTCTIHYITTWMVPY